MTPEELYDFDSAIATATPAQLERMLQIGDPEGNLEDEKLLRSVHARLEQLRCHPTPPSAVVAEAVSDEGTLAGGGLCPPAVVMSQGREVAANSDSGPCHTATCPIFFDTGELSEEYLRTVGAGSCDEAECSRQMGKALGVDDE